MAKKNYSSNPPLLYIGAAISSFGLFMIAGGKGKEGGVIVAFGALLMALGAL